MVSGEPCELLRSLSFHKKKGKQDEKESSASSQSPKKDTRNNEPKDLGDMQHVDEDGLFDGLGKLNIPNFDDGLYENEEDEVDRLLMILGGEEHVGVDDKSELDEGVNQKLDKGKTLTAEDMHLAIVPTEVHTAGEHSGVPSTDLTILDNSTL
ncbi:hypothetical protein ABZP36_031834 [Zizania latifolia]